MCVRKLLLQGPGQRVQWVSSSDKVLKAAVWHLCWWWRTFAIQEDVQSPGNMTKITRWHVTCCMVKCGILWLNTVFNISVHVTVPGLTLSCETQVAGNRWEAGARVELWGIVVHSLTSWATAPCDFPVHTQQTECDFYYIIYRII